MSTTTELPEYLYKFNISQHLSEEYIPYVYDLVRIVVLQFVYHMMYYISDPDTVGANVGNIVESILYISLGVTVYWLLFRKLVVLT